MTGGGSATGSGRSQGDAGPSVPPSKMSVMSVSFSPIVGPQTSKTRGNVRVWWCAGVGFVGFVGFLATYAPVRGRAYTYARVGQRQNRQNRHYRLFFLSRASKTRTFPKLCRLC